jgi:hypothetical protein
MDWFVISLDLLVIQHRSHEYSSSQIRIDAVDFVIKGYSTFNNKIQKLKEKSPEKTAVRKWLWSRNFYLGCG